MVLRRLHLEASMANWMLVMMKIGLPSRSMRMKELRSRLHTTRPTIPQMARPISTTLNCGFMIQTWL